MTTSSHRTVRFYRKRLPHWEVVDGRYFITLRLAGTLPPRVVMDLRALLALAGRQEDEAKTQTHRAVFRKMEAWLDRLSGADWLTRPCVADVLMTAVAHYQTAGRWRPIEYVVMPNHMHLFVSFGETPMRETLEDFKRWTGREANRALGRRGEAFWEREWFDHWSRSWEQDERIRSYIRRNPVKAGLVEDHIDWPYSSWGAVK